MKSSRLAVFSIFLVVSSVGCAFIDIGLPSPVTVLVETSPSVVQHTVRPDERPLIEGMVSVDGLRMILSTSDLAVGHNRIAFVLTSSDGFVIEPVAIVSSRLIDDSGDLGEIKQTAKAELKLWPYGERGMYVTDMKFDWPGTWRLEVSINYRNGLHRTSQLEFEVLQTPSAPAIGHLAVKSKTRTVTDVDSLAELTTGSFPDPDLYQTTIEWAVESGLPTVVVFASPAFCTNAVCGPQVEVLKRIKDRYHGLGNFVHVDFYDNPDVIQGDFGIARLSPAVIEWRLPSIQWTFVIDRAGKVSARFEGFATFDEVEEAFNRVI